MEKPIIKFSQFFYPGDKVTPSDTTCRKHPIYEELEHLREVAYFSLRQDYESCPKERAINEAAIENNTMALHYGYDYSLEEIEEKSVELMVNKIYMHNMPDEDGNYPHDYEME